MIRVRIQIGDGAIEDTFTTHKLIYKESDNRTEAPIKKRDVSSYVEQAGDNTDPRTVQDAFDYKVTFIIEGRNRNLVNVNSIVAAFNRKLYTQAEGSDIRTYKEVTFYNDFKRVKIVGVPEPIAEPKKMLRSRSGIDYAEVELTIRVTDPGQCDWNMAAVEESYGAGDLVRGRWYGIYESNGRERAYEASDMALGSVRTWVRAGDVVTLTTSVHRAAVPWVITDGDRYVLEKYEGDAAELTEETFTAGFGGYLCVSCLMGSAGNFRLHVGAPAANTMSQEPETMEEGIGQGHQGA